MFLLVLNPSCMFCPLIHNYTFQLQVIISQVIFLSQEIPFNKIIIPLSPKPKEGIR